MWQIAARCRTNAFITFIYKNLGAAPTFKALNKHAIVSLFRCFAVSARVSDAAFQRAPAAKLDLRRRKHANVTLSL